MANLNLNYEVAKNLANAGLPLLPCNTDKRAILPDWPNAASDDQARITEWFEKGDAAPAINLRPTNLVVIDIDNHEGGANGVVTFKALLKENNANIKDWVIVKTPNGGWHCYFYQPANGERIGNSASKIAPGVDVRGDGGYILAPGAYLSEGKRYISREGYPDLADAYLNGTLPELPEWVVALLSKPKYEERITIGEPPSDKYARSALERECGKVATAANGQRNHTLNAAAFSLGQFIPTGTLTRPDIVSGLLNAALGVGLPKDEALATINSGIDKGEGQPRVVPERNERMRIEEISAPRDDEWSDPVALPEGLIPVEPFDLRYLPENIAPWVGDIAERMQCPLDFVGIPAMVALGATLGRKVAIRPQSKTDWYEVPNLWGMIIGRPGMMKSPAMQEALKPLNRLEAKARADYDNSLKGYDLASEVFKIEKANAQKEAAKGKDIASILSRLVEPQPPTDRRYIMNDTTYERLGEVLSENPNGVLAFRDEMVTLLRGLDREEQAAARGFFLSAWNGTGAYTFDRIGRGKKHIEAACLSLLGSTQPGRIAEYVGRATSGGAGDDGLIQRFGLMVWPDQSLEWREVDKYPDSEARENARNVFEAFDALTPDSVKAVGGDDGSLPHLRFDDGALDAFKEWRFDLEHRLRGDDLSPSLESHLAKYRSLIPSLALINHLAEGGVGSVTETAVVRAIAFSQYLESHARRIYSAGVQGDVAAAKAILKRIRSKDLADGFTQRDVHRPNWSGLTDANTVKAGLDILCDHDWLIARQEASTDTQGRGRPKVTYWINPRGNQ